MQEEDRGRLTFLCWIAAYFVAAVLFYWYLGKLLWWIAELIHGLIW